MWFDTEQLHDGPATAMRLVIDVSAVSDADTSQGFGSVYFSQTGARNAADIEVADFRSATGTRNTGSAVVPLDGVFYVTGSSE
jgi:hypothetical protein